MCLNMRKHYIDNLRWITLLLLIPYHAAMAWNVWGEPNYIIFEGNRLISSIIVFFSPYFMPLLFVLAGMSTKFALQRRTIKEYLVERTQKLFIPFLFGTITIMPIMSYIGDVFNYSYNSGFFQHYAVFFAKFTDLTGADGGFSLGQFWFLLYLMVISFLAVGIIKLFKKVISESKKEIPFWLVLLLGLPLPFLSEILSIGGKSLAEYTYLFLIGYFIFADDKVINKAEHYRWCFFSVGLVASLLNVYLFVWADKEFALLNTIAKYISEWVAILALAGLAKRYLNLDGRVSIYMRTRSFLFYIYHFIWVVLFQYLLYETIENSTFVLFVCTIALSYAMTFICCEISIRIPFLCFLTGTKYKTKK